MYRALQLEGTPVRTGVPSQTAEIEIKVGNTVNDGWHASCVRYAIRPDNGITKQFKRIFSCGVFLLCFWVVFLQFSARGRRTTGGQGPGNAYVSHGVFCCVFWLFFCSFLLIAAGTNVSGFSFLLNEKYNNLQLQFRC